ncbi:hypothetical protein [Tessaracoccus sp.]
MTNRTRTRPARPVITHDDDGSMILALLVILILTSLVTLVLTVTISQQLKTRKVTDFTFAGQAADLAVNDALLLVNTGTAGADEADTYKVGNPRVPATAGDFTWSWYSATVPSPTPTFVITAQGCRNKNKGTAATPACAPGSARSVKVTLSGTVVDGVVSKSSKKAYLMTPELGFGRALYADEDLILQGSSTVGTSYNSVTAVPDTGWYGQVATNGLAAFSTTSAVRGGVNMSNTQVQPSPARCAATDANGDRQPCDQVQPFSATWTCAATDANGDRQPCDQVIVHDIRPKFQIVDTKFIDKAIADLNPTTGCGGQPLKPWVASEAPMPGHLHFPGIGPLCFSSMTFDMNTIVDAPARDVYVTGPIVVVPRKTVNAVQALPASTLLKIYSSGSVVSLGGSTNAAFPTKVAWAVWAPKALCATDSADGYVSVFGSMVCNKVFTQGVFTARWDEALATTATPQDATSGTREEVVWDVTGYEECSTCGP